jgi:putative ABC transport system permease protein
MRELLRRLQFLIKGRRPDDDIAEELAFHQDMKERELESAGLSPSGVRDASRRALGNELAARQYARDVWIAPWLQEISQDIKFGARLLARDRAFAITAILVLGFGIGVNNMLFTILRAHTMRGLPIERADRVLHISSFDDRTPDRGIAWLEFQDLAAEVKSFSALAAFVPSPVALGEEGRAPDRVEAAYVSANAFHVLGIQPAFGRTFDEHEDRPGAAPAAILGSAAWESRYARDPAILGRTVLVNGAPFTVIGVMRPRSGFPSTAELWLPLARSPAAAAAERRDVRTLRVLGRLREDLSAIDARAEVESIVARLAQQYPDTSRGNRARVVPINQRVLGRLTDPAWLAFMGFGFLALIMSSANAANLMLARAIQRAREIAVRASLGATRARVVRQLLIESAVLASAGSLLGIGVSLAGVRVFRTAIPPNTLPYWFEYEMDLPVLGALVGVAIGAVFIFGLVPAIYASRADVNRVLKTGGRGVVEAPESRRWTSAFMALQLGITVVMLSYLVVDVQAPSNDLASDEILDSREVLTGTVTLPADTYATPEQRRAFYRRLEDELQMMPAASVALASVAPRRGAMEQKLDVEGKIRDAGQEASSVATVAVGPRFFETLGLALERGREFADRDAVAGANTVIVSRRLVELFFPDQDPIGKRIRVFPATASSDVSPWLTIVGVAQQVQHRQPRDPVAYVPFHAAAPATASLLLRTREEQSTMTARLRESLRELDPNLPVYRVLTMAQVIHESQWNGRVASRLVRTITLIAFMFCIVGLYAVTAHAVAQRTHEIGIRMALGARPAHVAAMIVKRAALQVVLGLTLGIAGVILWSSAFGPGRADTNVASPSVVALVAALLTAATFFACLAPARRAVRLDPVAALRSE